MAFYSSPLDASERVDTLRRNKAEAKGRIREVLDWLVDRRRAPTVTKAGGSAIQGYCDDMLSDATYEKELEREIEEEIEANGDRVAVSAVCPVGSPIDAVPVTYARE